MLMVHPRRKPKPSEMLKTHSNARIILGKLVLMWMIKAPAAAQVGPLLWRT